jgi:hypothetical protein
MAPQYLSAHIFNRLDPFIDNRGVMIKFRVTPVNSQY